MERRTLVLGYRKSPNTVPEVWVALRLPLSHDCTNERRPQIVPECVSVEDFESEIDRIIEELRIIKLEGSAKLES
jgi:hypothetical protein